MCINGHSKWHLSGEREKRKGKGNGCLPWLRDRGTHSFLPPTQRSIVCSADTTTSLVHSIEFSSTYVLQTRDAPQHTKQNHSSKTYTYCIHIVVNTLTCISQYVLIIMLMSCLAFVIDSFRKDIERHEAMQARLSFWSLTSLLRTSFVWIQIIIITLLLTVRKHRVVHAANIFVFYLVPIDSFA